MIKNKIDKLEQKILPPKPLPDIHVFVEEDNGYFNTKENRLFSKDEYQKFCDSIEGAENDLPQIVTIVGA